MIATCELTIELTSRFSTLDAERDPPQKSHDHLRSFLHFFFVISAFQSHHLALQNAQGANDCTAKAAEASHEHGEQLQTYSQRPSAAEPASALLSSTDFAQCVLSALALVGKSTRQAGGCGKGGKREIGCWCLCGGRRGGDEEACCR